VFGGDYYSNSWKKVYGQLAKILKKQVYREDKKGDCIFFEFYSYRELILEVIDEAQEFLAKFINESEAMGIKVILRELLMNAVIHGNRSNEKLTVKCNIEHLEDKDFKILVEDEGNGFAYNNDMADEIQNVLYPIKRKGYFLINRLSERIEFSDQQNRITVYHKAEI
jgi:serine/threonine-protein kinase RsbW